jgi:hypothetical protein
MPTLYFNLENLITLEIWNVLKDHLVMVGAPFSSLIDNKNFNVFIFFEQSHSCHYFLDLSSLF